MLVPKLRFPEFKNEEEWNEKRLDEACEVNPAIEKLPEAFVYIDLESVEDGILLQKKYIQLESAPSRAQRLLTDGDIIFQMVRPYQMNNLFFSPDDNQSYVASTGYAQLRAFESKMYLFQYLHTKYFVQRVLAKCTGSNYPAINSSDLAGIKIEIPKLFNEQQKIASCLSSLDDLITAHTQKLDALKAHKKGLMQQLFPAKGEKVPKLRFEEFKDSGEWEFSTIENYIELLSGIPLKSEELSDDISGVPILRGINITEGYIRHSKDIDKYFLGNTEEIKKYLVLENDLVVAMDGSKVGKNVALIKKEDEGSLLIQRVARIRTNEKSDINYIYQHIFSENFRNYVDKVNTSSGIPHISSQQIKDFKIGFPSLKEQQKIAACLSSLDELITEQAERIEQLKMHKKGLMQGLFPSITVNN